MGSPENLLIPFFSSSIWQQSIIAVDKKIAGTEFAHQDCLKPDFMYQIYVPLQSLQSQNCEKAFTLFVRKYFVQKIPCQSYRVMQI